MLCLRLVDGIFGLGSYVRPGISLQGDELLEDLVDLSRMETVYIYSLRNTVSFHMGIRRR